MREGLLLIAALTLPAMGQRQTSPPSADVLWATIIDSKVREQHDWRTIAILTWGAELHKENPSLRPETILEYMRTNEAVSSGIYDTTAKTTLEAIPELAGVPGPLVHLGGIGASAYADHIAPTVTESEWFGAYNDSPLKFFYIHARSEKDYALAKITDEWLQTHLNNPPSVQASSDTMLARDPILATELKTDEVKHAIVDSMEKSDRQQRNIDKRLQQISATLNANIEKGMRKSSDSASDKDIAQIHTEASEARLVASLYANLLSVSGDKALGKIGNTFNTLAQPLITLNETVSLFKNNQASTLMLATSTMGVGLAIAGLTQGGSSVSDQHLASIDQTLVEMRKEMEKEFEIVDEKLDALLQATAETLRLLQENRQAITEVQSSLNLQSNKLDEINRSILHMQDILLIKDRVGTKLRCIESGARFGEIKDADWQECLTRYLEFAATASADAGNPPNGTALYLRLQGEPSAHLATIINAVRALQGEGPTPVQFQDASAWSAATADYLRFTSMWPKRRVPKRDLEILASDGRTLLGGEQGILGATRLQRSRATVAMGNSLADAETNLQRLLDLRYQKSREELIRQGGEAKPAAWDLGPCPSGVVTHWPGLVPTWRNGPPTYHLDKTILSSVNHVYLARAIGLMPELTLCYFDASWGEPFPPSDRGNPGTARLKIHVLAGGTAVGDVEVSQTMEMGPFDLRTNWEFSSFPATISSQLASALKAASEEYLKTARSLFDQNEGYRREAWKAVAKEPYVDGTLKSLLEATTSSRMLIEQALLLGGAASFERRAHLRDLISSSTSFRVPDDQSVEATLECLRTDRCSPEGFSNEEVLVGGGTAALIGTRLSEVVVELQGVAVNDPLAQADPGTSLSLARVELKLAEPKYSIRWWLYCGIALIVGMVALLIGKLRRKPQ